MFVEVVEYRTKIFLKRTCRVLHLLEQELLSLRGCHEEADVNEDEVVILLFHQCQDEVLGLLLGGEGRAVAGPPVFVD